MTEMLNQYNNALMNGTSFFNEAQAFHFSFKHIDMFDQQGAKNFEKIKQETLKTSASLPYSRDFSKSNLETNKKEAIAFTEEFLGTGTAEALKTIPIEKAALPLFDAATEFHYDGNQRTIRAGKIILFRTDLSYSALSLVHENTHILFNHPAPQKGFHIHYNELLPILMELIATIRFQDTLKDSKLLQHYLDIRIKTLHSHFEEYSSGIALRIAGAKNLIPIEYSIHNSYSYIICTIYALRLFEQYKENPNATKQIIQSAIAHKITVEQLLQKTNTSLKDNETIIATQKILKMYQK
ncbi:MAG: hypothetical protein HFH08_06740 [Bacilli bacterium]|nr:hypothetical protein [Bacilli bacterium]